MAKMTFVATSDPIDLRTWGFADGGPLNKAAAELVTDVLQEQFTETPPELDLPFYWSDSDGRGGPKIQDPLTIYLDLPLSDSEDCAHWSVSLVDLISDFIESIENWHTHTVDDPKNIEMCRALATALREQADRLNAVCKQENQNV